MLTITTDEDFEVGFMLANEDAPKTREERIQAFCSHAACEWYLQVIDPSVIHHQDEKVPYVDEGDFLRRAKEGEEATGGYWYLFGLYAIEVVHCIPES